MIQAGKGQPLVLLHGLGGSIESWANNIEYLSKKFRVFSLDLPGFGQSDKPDINYRMAFYRDFFVNFLKQLNLSRVSIVGSSLGGHIACEVAIAMPDLVDRLVLVSPAGALPRSFKGSPALKRYLKVTTARSVDEVRKALFAVDKKPVDESHARTVFQRFSEPNAREAFLSALRGSGTAPRLSARLDKISSPTLLIWGKEDIMIPARFAEPFLRMKNCRVLMLEHCGHRVHAEKPEIFNAQVSAFLKEGEDCS